MATYVLVHGGGHGGWCWQKVASRLRAAGHEVHTPTLTGLGERSHLIGPGIGLDTHITDVVNMIRFEGLTDVILGGHSYGGMVITGVADRVPDSIRRLVYLDAAHPANGQSLADVTPSLMGMARSMGQVIDGVELVLLPMEGAGRFYGVEDDADVAWMDARLTAHPWKTFEDKLQFTNEQRLRRIPRANINCIPSMDPDDDSHARQRDGDHNYEIETGHDLMITEPAEVARILLELADV
jgi:pimeloyl-ACP methyl ester carboxylesterase